MAIVRPTLLRDLVPSVHGGVDARELTALGIDPAAVIDFSANQSPLGPSPRIAAAIARADAAQYPDRDAQPLANALAARHGLSPAQVVAGNGSTELIRLIAQLALGPGDAAALLCAHTFGEYATATALAGARCVVCPFPAEDAADLPRFSRDFSGHYRLAWLCSPNNPTGVATTPADIAWLVREHPETLFVLDEAYCDLLPAPQWTPELLENGNLIVLRSMTKAWGLAGLRLGYALGGTALMTPLRAAKPPWNVNACAQAAGLAALEDNAHYASTLTMLRTEQAHLRHTLREQGWAPRTSAAAFFLVRVGAAARIKLALLQRGCLVRDCASFGLPEYIRVSPRLPEQNGQLLAAMAALRAEGVGA